jgi:hypothetical protein
VRQLVEVYDDLLESCSFLSERLRPFRIVPDAGLFQLATYFRQALCLGFVVKGTPLTRSRAR